MKNICLLFIAFATLLSCQKKVKNQNLLTYPISGEISSLDPARSYDTISSKIINQCYEQLFEYHYLKRPYTLQPLLAEAMPIVSEDKKTYTIKIKKNIQYHDDPSFKGKPRFVKAQDFITQIKRLAFVPTKSNGYWLFDGKIEGLNEFRSKAGRDLKKFEKLQVKGLQAPDDHTLVITLTMPYPQMLYALAMGFTSPLPMESVIFHKNLMFDRIIGTGPYKLKDFNTLSHAKLTRNENFHDNFYPTTGDRIAHKNKLLEDAGKKIPFIDDIHFTVIKESRSRWLNFKSKKLDLIIIPRDNYSSVIRADGSLDKLLVDQGVKLEVSPTLTYWWLAFNMNDPLLGKNLYLRQAIAHAIDFEKYIKVFTNNVGLRANSIYPPGIPGYSPNSKLPYTYDIKKAKELLKKAGYPNGKGLPTFTYDTRGSVTQNRQESQFIKSELAKIGIKIEVQLNTFPAFLIKSRNSKLQFWQGGWAMDYPDAENVVQLLLSNNHSPGPNTSLYKNKEVDKMFEKLRFLENGEEKFKLMADIEKTVSDDLPWIMQYYSREYILRHERLKNYRASDLVYNNFKYLRIE